MAERADVLPALAEVFRQYGYDGASLSLISQATGLGKGSLYHFFPGGKEEMAEAVLAEIQAWFEVHVFTPLRATGDTDAIAKTFDAVEQYFHSGRRVCLVGALAIGETRDRFVKPLRAYFVQWIEALGEALKSQGWTEAAAAALSEEIVGSLQGAIVLGRALDDPGAFDRTMTRLKARLHSP